MGTSFGLGMYLPTPITFPMLIGGAGRDWWEKKKLAPKVAAIRALEGAGAAEKKRALMLLFTFMIAAGALTGEAFYGVEAAILAALDESAIGAIDNWPTIRFASFLILNVLLGFLIYALFRQAGILGSSGDGDSDSGADVLDAELT
jgi:hypothetical protein